MKRLAFLIGWFWLLASQAQDSDFRRQVQSTSFTRDLLVSTNATQARTKLGITSSADLTTLTASNISALTSIDIGTIAGTGAVNVAVLGYSSPGDWGGQRFARLDTESTLALETGVVLTNSSGSGRWIFDDAFSGQPVDVKWFGAVSDPSLSVTSHGAIQSAIEFVNARTNSSGNRVGGTVKIPAGIYAISTSIVLRPRVNLVGEFSHYSDGNLVTASVTNTSYAAGGSVQIVLLGNSNVPMMVNDPTDSELYVRQDEEPQEDGSTADSKQYSMLIKGIAFYVAAQTKYDCHILKLYHAWGVRVEDCYFWTRFGYAVWLKDCNAFKAINSRFIGGSFTEGGRGILMWGTGDSKLIDCELGGMVGPGVWITGSSAGKDTILGNQIFNQQRHRQQITGYDTGTDTITLDANHWLETGMLSEWTKVSGATPTTNLNQHQPYWVIKVSTNSLKLATTESNALAGTAIDLTGAIAGTNYIWSGPGGSLYGSWNAENMVVTGNRFEQNQETGIYLSDSPGWEITGNMTYYNQYDNVGGTKDAISVPNIYLRGNNVGTIIQGNSLDADTVRYGPDYGIQVEDSSAAFISARVLLGPNGIRKSVVQDYMIGTNNPHAIITRYSTNESTSYSGLFISRLETIGAKLGNTNSGADVTIPLELQTPASGVPVITARRLSFPKLGIRITGTGMGAGNQNGWLFMNEEEGYFGAQIVASTNVSTLRLGGTGAFQSYTRHAEIAGDIGGVTDLPSMRILFNPPLGTGAGSTNSAGHLFRLPYGGASGATAHSLYDAVLIGPAGSSPVDYDTPLELWDYATATRKRVKRSSGAEQALYLGTEPTFGGGGGSATNVAFNDLTDGFTNGWATGNPAVWHADGTVGPTNSLTASNLTITGELTLGQPIPVASITNLMATDAEVAAAVLVTSVSSDFEVVAGDLSLTNTTGTGAIMRATSPTFGTSLIGDTDAFIQLDEHASAPSTPASGNVRVYAKADGKVYRKDDAGTEAELGGGSGGTSVFVNDASVSGPNFESGPYSDIEASGTNITVVPTRVHSTTISFASTNTLSLATNAHRTLVLTGDSTFDTGAVSNGVSVTVLLQNTQATNVALAFPGAWTFLNVAMPTSLAAGKDAILALQTFGTASTNVYVSYAAEP